MHDFFKVLKNIFYPEHKSQIEYTEIIMLKFKKKLEL